MNTKNIYSLNSTVILLIALLLSGGSLMAKENIGGGKREGRPQRTSAGCASPTGSAKLDVNNVRTTIFNGGDMWWDLVGTARYEVPKNNTAGATPKNALFAGAIWIGGLDGGNQLRLAAQTYRQTGTDYYTGPLDASAEVDAATCAKYDKLYTVYKADVDNLITAYQAGTLQSGGYTVPQSISEWPARRSLADPDLAPFEDVDGNGVYDPNTGDYPAIFGDEAIWFVYNDKGNLHSETSAEPIGLEIQTMAFAFATNDEINNATFYKSKITNRSTNTLNQTYIGQWVDPDLGNYADDYVGCDTTLGLGICYNGDNNDETAAGYGTLLPAVGVDFFEGPLADAGDGIDNDKDGTIDEANEKIIMSKFVYYNNDFTVVGNPSTAQHFYNYLDGAWKDGEKIANDGKDGRASTTPNLYTPISTNYMFPGALCGGATGWNESSAGNVPADRRFIQSAGKFTLKPGAVNNVTIGVVFAQGTTPGVNTDAICNLIKADKKAQSLFDNNFKRVAGPDAPTVTAVELDKTIVLNWDNLVNSNNYKEGFNEKDPDLVIANVADTTYTFEGYLVYQVKDATVSVADIRDANKSRLIAQCDVKNGVTSIVNTTTDVILGNVNTLMVANVPGVSDLGTFKTLKVTADQFATGDNVLVNNKPYYFMVVAYAHNAFAVSEKFKQSDNARLVIAMPHIVNSENGGTITQSNYGGFLPITRIKGVGTGGYNLNLDEATVKEILANNSVSELTYVGGNSPIQVKVIDPKKVKALDYQLVITKELDRWFLIDKVTKDSIYYSGNTGPFNAAVLTADGTTNRIHVLGASGNVSRSFTPTTGDMSMTALTRITSTNINAADVINTSTNNKDMIIGVGDRGTMVYSTDSASIPNGVFKYSKLNVGGDRSEKLTSIAISGDYNTATPLQNTLITGTAKNISGQIVSTIFSMRYYANTVVKTRPSQNAKLLNTITGEEYISSEYLVNPVSGSPTAWIGGNVNGTPKIKWADNSAFDINITVAATWTDATLPSGLSGTINGIYMKDLNNGYAVGTSGIFLTTTDGGKNWTNSASMLNNLNSTTLNAVTFNGTTGLLVGNKGKVYYSTDGGTTWTEDKSLQNKSVAFQQDLKSAVLVTSGATARGVISGTYSSVFTFDNSLAANQKVSNVANGQINVGGEELLEEYGLGITVKFVGSPGQIKPTDITTSGNATQSTYSSMTFKDNTKKWLTGLANIDDHAYRSWIVRAPLYSTLMNDASYNGKGIDPSGEYLKTLGGTWAPLRMTRGAGTYTIPATSTSQFTDGPFPSPGKFPRDTNSATYLTGTVALNNLNLLGLPQDGGVANTANQLAISAAYNNGKTYYNGNILPNVDIVFTPDVSKWSKCLVVETTTEIEYLPPNAKQKRPYLYKRDASKVISGNTLVNSTVAGDIGYSYFPGYAIDVTTGERLNIFFGEASRFGANNGNDMMWNPTSDDGFHIINSTPVGVPKMGGKHYVYVANTRYDSCKTIRSAMDSVEVAANNSLISSTELSRKLGRAYASVAWVGIPLLAKGESLLSSEVTVKLRTDRKFDAFNPALAAKDSLNYYYPVYNFSTKGFEVMLNNNEQAKNALDLIRIVPNPYMAYSSYEQSQLDTRIRITNLPQKVKIKIFTLSGHLVKTIDKDDPSTVIDWNLQNTGGVPVASGVYIFHIDAPGIGEKVLKWFGVMRPVDLDSF